MGASGSLDQNIALVIQSAFDPTGTDAARGGISALAQEAQAASDAQSAGALKAAADQQAVATAVNASIGAFERMGRSIDVTNAQAVLAYRKQGDALAANLAQLGATDTELNRIGTTIARLERSAGAALIPPIVRPGDAEALERVPVSARRGADALSSLAFTAAGTDGSLRSVVVSSGLVASSFAQMSENAQLAASAAGLGALVVLFVTLIDLAGKARDAMNDMNVPTGSLTSQQQEHIRNIRTEAEAERELALARNQAAAKAAEVETLNDSNAIARAFNDKERAAALQGEADAIAKVAALEERRGAIEKKNAEEARTRQLGGLRVAAADASADPVARYQKNLALIEQERDDAIKRGLLTVEAADEQAAERKRQLLEQASAYEQSLSEQVSQLDAKRVLNQFDQRRELADRQYTDESTALNKLVLTEELRTKIAEDLRLKHQAIKDEIEQEQQAANQRAKDEYLAGSNNPIEQFNARLAMIDAEKRAQIQAGISVTLATAAAEQKKRQLYIETANVANENAKSMFDVLRSSHEKTLQAVGTFGENFRRIIIGAEAAHAMVKAVKEGAEAIASLASGDFRGAALHGAAALEFGKAAALGGQESLGGGGGGAPSAGSGAAGAAGGGYSNASPLTPQDQQAPTTVVVNLMTTDPYNRENIGTVSYQLQRQGKLNKPIYVPPTSGLRQL